jgi:hypothetical protein
MKMKTILLAVAALGLAVTSGFSQGSVTFQQSGGIFVYTNTASTSTKANSGMGIKIELLYQPDTGGSAPDASGLATINGSLGNWEQWGTLVSVGSPTPGNFSATTETTGTDVTAGSPVWATAIAWSGGYANLGAAQTAGATFYGVANAGVWVQNTYGGTQSATSTSAAWTGLVLTPTPEPATIALGGLGAAALLLFRRRK